MRRVAWSAWRGRVVAGRFAADHALQLAWGMKRQQLKRGWAAKYVSSDGHAELCPNPKPGFA